MAVKGYHKEERTHCSESAVGNGRYTRRHYDHIRADLGTTPSTVPVTTPSTVPVV